MGSTAFSVHSSVDKIISDILNILGSYRMTKFSFVQGLLRYFGLSEKLI